MAHNKTVTILVVALVAAFFVLLLIPASYVPYAKAPNYSVYENFAEGAAVQEDVAAGLEDVAAGLEDAMVTDKKPNNKSLDLPSSAAMDAPASNLKTENFEPMTEVSQMIRYGTLRDSEIIDKFSQVTSNGMDGVNGCVSSGLSNSGGYMCLSPELIQLLKTRGGNATGN